MHKDSMAFIFNIPESVWLVDYLDAYQSNERPCRLIIYLGFIVSLIWIGYNCKLSSPIPGENMLKLNTHNIKLSTDIEEIKNSLIEYKKKNTWSICQNLNCFVKILIENNKYVAVLSNCIYTSLKLFCHVFVK